MSKHTPTPGPWRYTDGWIEAGPHTIAQIIPIAGVDEANGRLMAAAPTMLEALKWARTCVPYPSDCHAAIVAAIAAAEGTDNG